MPRNRTKFIDALMHLPIDELIAALIGLFVISTMVVLATSVINDLPGHTSLPASLPATPATHATHPTATPLLGGMVRLSWPAVAGATSYQWTVTTVPRGQAPTVIGTVEQNGDQPLSVLVGGLHNGWQYQAYVGTNIGTVQYIPWSHTGPFHGIVASGTSTVGPALAPVHVTTVTATPAVISTRTGVVDPDSLLSGGSTTITGPAAKHGHATLDVVNDTFTYTPNPGYTGNDTFTYTMCEYQTPSKCFTGEVVVTVN